MVFHILSSVIDLIIQELEEDAKVIKEILNFYGHTIIQDFSSNKEKKEIRKKMKKATSYKQWKSLAVSFDKLPGEF